MDEDEKEPSHRYFIVISVTDEMTPYRVVFGLKVSDCVFPYETML